MIDTIADLVLDWLAAAAWLIRELWAPVLMAGVTLAATAIGLCLFGPIGAALAGLGGFVVTFATATVIEDHL